MKRLFAVVLCGLAVLLAVLVGLGAIVAWALRAPPPQAAPERGVELGRVTLVEPGGERRGPVSLRVDGDRIGGIGPPLAGDAGALAGAFVLPGLTDMHAHFPFTRFPGDEEYTALLFLLHGVTAVRLTGGAAPESIAEWRRRVGAGEVPGPRFFTCGPIIDGADPVIPGSRSVASPDQARAIVDELSRQGVDCIKAYDRLDLATTIALREAAHRAGLTIVGHTPQAVSLDDAHLDDVQHLRGVHPPFQGEELRYPHFLRAWHRLDDGWLEHVVDVSRRRGIAHTPTLVAVAGTVVSHDWESWRRSPAMQLWLPHLRDGVWSGEVGFSPGRFASQDDVDMVREATRQMARTVRVLHTAGIPLHTGTDSNAPNVVPGASLHREIALLVDAGLSAEDALEASTRRSPAFLGVEAAGELRPGAPADLVLFREDPSLDIAALGTLTAVVRGGRLYTRDDLRARLERYREHHEGFAFRNVLMPALRGSLRALTGWLRR